jgi:hypothetical protein
MALIRQEVIMQSNIASRVAPMRFPGMSLIAVTWIMSQSAVAAACAAGGQAEVDRQIPAKAERASEEGATDPAAPARRWFADWASRSFAAASREPAPVPGEQRVGEAILRITPASDIAAEWGALMADPERNFTGAGSPVQRMIEEAERVSPLEARILRFSLGRRLIAAGRSELAREVLLKALPTEAAGPVRAGDRPDGRREPHTDAASSDPTRLDVEVLRALAATHRDTDRVKCAEYLRAALETYRRLPARAQVLSGTAVWNAAFVRANVLSELGAHAEAAELLRWAYGELRLERSVDDERALVFVKAGYSMKAGNSAEGVADLAWLVTHAPEWVWGRDDYASIPHRTIQDAVAAGLLKRDASLELLASLSHAPEAASRPLVFAGIANECLVFAAKPDDRAIARSETALRLLLAMPRPSAEHKARLFDSRLQSTLSGLAFVYRGDGVRGVPARPAELERVKAIWKERFPETPLVVE